MAKMVLFKRLLPEEPEEQNRSSATALIYFYFWLSGGFLFLAACYGAYELIRGTSAFSAFRVALTFFFSFLFMTGAWLIGRFNRNGVILIAVGIAISIVSWINGLPRTNDIAFTVVTIIALIVAWEDLSSSPLRSSKK
jgi:hypothetical protein